MCRELLLQATGDYDLVVNVGDTSYADDYEASPILTPRPYPPIIRRCLLGQCKFQLLPPAPPYYPFYRVNPLNRGNIWSFTVADMNAATPSGRGRSVISLEGAVPVLSLSWFFSAVMSFFYLNIIQCGRSL